MFAFQSEPTAAPLIWKLQGPAIVGDTDDSEFGYSLALSKYNNTLVIGARGHNNSTGYVAVYRISENGGNRTQLGKTIYGDTTHDNFGGSVDITADGTTIICGSQGWWDQTTKPGYVRVFSLEIGDDLAGDSWKQIGQDITGEAIGDEFGRSVSISHDGKTIVVGANYNDGANGKDSGHVRIFRLDDEGSSWEQIGQDIDGDMAGVESGFSVSLSGNGENVVIGGDPCGQIGDIWTGQVKVFRIDSAGSSWEPLGESIFGDDAGDVFGWSVDITPDGNTVAIGSQTNDGNDGPGYVKVFSLESSANLGTSTWKQIGENIIGESTFDFFGRSISLSDDGKTLAVGAKYNEGNGINSGHVRVYRMDADSESGWMQIGDDIDGEEEGDYSGYSVSLSADGNTVAIGSPSYDSPPGHVRVFVLE